MKWVPWAALLLVLALLFGLPIRIPYSIEAQGKIVPQREWALVRQQEGTLVATLRNNLRGAVERYTVMGFDRGDQVTFQKNPLVVEGAAIDLGDTLGVYHSQELQRQWIQLKGDLADELARTAVDESGRKEPIVWAARIELERSRSQRIWQEREVDRLRKLWQRQLISDAELDQARNTLDQQRLQEEWAEAQVRVVRSGSKEQELEWRRSRILAMQEELGILGARLEKAVIRAPIGGLVSTLASGDTIAVVYDTTSFISLMPVRWQERGNVARRQQVEIPLAGKVLPATIVHLGQTAHSVGGQQYFSTKALIEGGRDLLVPGLVVRCAIVAAPLSPWEYLLRLLRS
jgi:hypothetical protein